MKPLEISARFAAFAWYIDYRQAPSRTLQAEARRFSEENWQAFLPVAQEGLGRLMLRVAKVRQHAQRRFAPASRHTKRQLAAAG
jgi:hypothetical protein